MRRCLVLLLFLLLVQGASALAAGAPEIQLELLGEPFLNQALRFRVTASRPVSVTPYFRNGDGLLSGLLPDDPDGTRMLRGLDPADETLPEIATVFEAAMIPTDPATCALEVDVMDEDGFYTFSLPLTLTCLGVSDVAPAKLTVPGRAVISQPCHVAWTAVAGAELYRLSYLSVTPWGEEETLFSTILPDAEYTFPADFFFDKYSGCLLVDALIPGYEAVSARLPFELASPLTLTLTGVATDTDILINSLDEWRVDAWAPGADNVVLSVTQSWSPETDREQGPHEGFTYRSVMDATGSFQISARAQYGEHTVSAPEMFVRYTKLGDLNELDWQIPDSLQAGQPLTLSQTGDEGHVRYTEVLVFDRSAYPDGIPGTVDETPAAALETVVCERLTGTGLLTLKHLLPPGDYWVVVRPRPMPGWYYHGSALAGLCVSSLPGDADGDGALTLADAVSALACAAGEASPDPAAADLSGDGEVTVLDAYLILEALCN